MNIGCTSCSTMNLISFSTSLKFENCFIAEALNSPMPSVDINLYNEAENTERASPNCSIKILPCMHPICGTMVRAMRKKSSSCMRCKIKARIALAMVTKPPFRGIYWLITFISVRRFTARPSSVWLFATGFVSP